MHGQNQSLLLHHRHRRLHIPKEILFDEILPRLPVKSLLRFRCVSKSWLSLIESDEFIKTQYQNSRKNPSWAHHRVVLSPILYDWHYELKECSLRRLLTSNEASSSIDNCTTRHNQPRKECAVVGCYNGVVCLLDYATLGRKRFLLWNPSTRNSTELPTMITVRGGYLLSKYGFGWDQSSGAYKVFVVITLSDGLVGSVYSSETDSWKTVTGVKTIGYWSGSGLFAGGSLHWFRDSDHDIESFDLEREDYGTIEMPPSAAKSIHLGEIGGSLSILLFNGEKRSSEVWLMKEYGVKGSWFKLLTLPWDKLMMNHDRLRSLFGEGPNGEIFLVSKAGFMVYTPKDATLMAAKHGISFAIPHVYVESLVSPRRRSSVKHIM